MKRIPVDDSKNDTWYISLLSEEVTGKYSANIQGKVQIQVMDLKE